MDNKGQSGLVTGLVFGIASLIIGVIIAFVIVSTLTGAGLMTSGRSTISVTDEVTWINSTTDTLTVASVVNFIPGTITVDAIINTTGGEAIAAGNYTISNAGIIVNASAVEWDFVTINYTYQTYSSEEMATTNLEQNFTAGVDNVSAKVPTVLLIAAIVLIMGVLAILVAIWYKMKLNGSSL